MNVLNYSESESKILKIRVGRSELEDLDTNKLLEDIVRKNYDVVKLAVPSIIPNLYSKLDSLCIPYYVLGILSRYRLILSGYQLKEYNSDSIDFEIYDGNQYDMLKNLAKGSFQETPGSYFSNPLIDSIISHEQQLECFAEYVCSFNNQISPSKFMYLTKIKGEYVGFIGGEWINNNDILATLAGVIPEMREKGIYKDIVRFMQNWSYKNNVRWLFADGQIQNPVVQKVYVREDMIVTGGYINIHINSLFDRTEKSIKEIDITCRKNNSLQIQLVELISDVVKAPFKLSEYKLRLLKKLPDGVTLKLQISYPIFNTGIKLILVKLYTLEDVFAGYAYFTYHPR